MAPMGVFERNGAWGGGILKVSGAFSSKKLTEGLLPLVVQRSEENFLHKRGKFSSQEGKISFTGRAKFSKSITGITKLIVNQKGHIEDVLVSLRWPDARSMDRSSSR